MKCGVTSLAGITGYSRGCRCSGCVAAKHEEYIRNKPKRLLQSAEFKKTVSGRLVDKKWRLRKRYGLSLDAYTELYERQDGRCAICLCRPEKKDIHLDHDHVTGVIRGFLCGRCNRGLGMFQDTAYLLHSAAEYLERNKKEQK